MAIIAAPILALTLYYHCSGGGGGPELTTSHQAAAVLLQVSGLVMAAASITYSSLAGSNKLLREAEAGQAKGPRSRTWVIWVILASDLLWRPDVTATLCFVGAGTTTSTGGIYSREGSSRSFFFFFWYLLDDRRRLPACLLNSNGFLTCPHCRCNSTIATACPASAWQSQG